VLRLQNVYGPGQSLTNSYTGIVALFSRLARSGAVIPLYEDGLVTRDFVYIDDVAAAFVAALERPARQPRVLDIGSGVASTIEDMARALAEFYGAPAPKVSGLFRDGDVRHASCTVDAAERELGWRPSVDLATGVASLQHWIADVESTMPG
jgi:dTDP-L-rhamnose 4-epimerase